MPTPRRLNFDDLVFQPLSPDSITQKATLQFRNGYGCNVYYRSPATNRELCYEFELLYRNVPTWHHRISDGNVGYCSKSDISSILIIAQKL